MIVLTSSQEMLLLSFSCKQYHGGQRIWCIIQLDLTLLILRTCHQGVVCQKPRTLMLPTTPCFLFSFLIVLQYKFFGIVYWYMRMYYEIQLPVVVYSLTSSSSFKRGLFVSCSSLLLREVCIRSFNVYWLPVLYSQRVLGVLLYDRDLVDYCRTLYSASRSSENRSCIINMFIHVHELEAHAQLYKVSVRFKCISYQCNIV